MDISVTTSRLLFLICAASLIVVAGCHQQAPSESPGLTPAGAVVARADGDDGPPVAKPKYTLAVSIYVGWMPWYYADKSGILKKWADREGIKIQVVDMDYVASIEAFVAGKADACLMTNMEALDLPAATGVDTTAIIVGDYSNGNDKILTRGIESIAALRGVEVSLVESSVSDYLLNRALESVDLSQSDVKLHGTGDSKIGNEFISNQAQKAVVTWNPIAMQLEREPNVRCIYDSSKIPGEILDLCVVNTRTLKRDPRLGRALVGAWYEVLSLMQQHNASGGVALTDMAERAGCSNPELTAQLQTTFMFWIPAAAADYSKSPALKTTMESVRQFCFAKKLLGENAKSVDDVGISYPDGAIQGNPENVKLRFDATFMNAAAVSQ
jgi:NitT/TauT family transport system substrate-binding protein